MTKSQRFAESLRQFEQFRDKKRKYLESGELTQEEYDRLVRMKARQLNL